VEARWGLETRAKWVEGVAQAVKPLLCKHEALSSSHSPIKKKKVLATIYYETSGSCSTSQGAINVYPLIEADGNQDSTFSIWSTSNATIHREGVRMSDVDICWWPPFWKQHLLSQGTVYPNLNSCAGMAQILPGSWGWNEAQVLLIRVVIVT
jgi:hypothetical protein